MQSSLILNICFCCFSVKSAHCLSVSLFLPKYHDQRWQWKMLSWKWNWKILKALQLTVYFYYFLPKLLSQKHSWQNNGLAIYFFGHNMRMFKGTTELFIFFTQYDSISKMQVLLKVLVQDAEVLHLMSSIKCQKFPVIEAWAIEHLHPLT